MIVHCSIVLDKLPEGDTQAFNARSKLDAQNVPTTAEESNQNKQSGCVAIFILLHGNTLHRILSLNEATLLEADAKNPTRFFSSKLSDSAAVSPGLTCSRALDFVTCLNAKLQQEFVI